MDLHKDVLGTVELFHGEHAGDSVRGQNCAEFPAKTDVRAPGVLTPVLTLVTLHTLVYVIAVTAVVPNHKSFSTSTLEGAWDIDAFVDTVVAVKDALVYVCTILAVFT